MSAERLTLELNRLDGGRLSCLFAALTMLSTLTVRHDWSVGGSRERGQGFVPSAPASLDDGPVCPTAPMDQLELRTIKEQAIGTPCQHLRCLLLSSHKAI